ncbi:glycosyl-4,4'-diaponeurosporenoate acyltransferase CrtO family protein [Salmonirosea aquatica]|uniref:Glycosyl-4,4'-diaponeurosporenoate acyltransferase n=1 Tax=Salmonirosea aquatica TaxID=2654236 RepID=A0A7C9FQ89_9BACT|nr:hypothetical protein [Cytophagaceae bacterium SJW1-29]
MKKTILNQLINVLWTAIGVAPLVIYWVKSEKSLYIVLGCLTLSMIFGFLPDGFYGKFQLSPRRKFYEKIGIKTIGNFTQNGGVVNRITSADGRTGWKRDFFRGYHKTIALYERFHCIGFVFSSLTCLLALLDQFYLLAVLVFLANAVYNLLPILLQQYNKVRLRNIGQTGR